MRVFFGWILVIYGGFALLQSAQDYAWIWPFLVGLLSFLSGLIMVCFEPLKDFFDRISYYYDRMICLIGIHHMNGCECTRCDYKSEGGHLWKGCVCEKCGETRSYKSEDGHYWKGCVCEKCGKNRHDWQLISSRKETCSWCHGEGEFHTPKGNQVGNWGTNGPDYSDFEDDFWTSSCEHCEGGVTTINKYECTKCGDINERGKTVKKYYPI